MDHSLRLREVVQQLQQHPNHLRIKKLLFGTCRQGWENDPVVLDRCEWVPLLQDLLQRYSSLEQLRGSLFRVVASLNRQAQYTLVAQAILDALQPLYDPSDGDESTQAIATSLKSASPESLPRVTIAQSLEHHPHYLRIKKLIYGVCYRTWENDPQVLECYPLGDLVRKLRTSAPSLTYLAVVLNRKAATLNRKTEYMGIAHTICEAMRPLYEDAIAPSAPPSSSSLATAAFTEGTRAEADLPPVSAQMTDEPPDLTLPHLEQPEYTQPSALPIADPLFEPFEPRVTAAPEAIAFPASVSQFSSDRSDLFELRLKIVRYANPLRVKLLLFCSVVRTFDFSAQDWSDLRAFTLEDLLRKLFDTYASLDEVEVNLTRAAYALPQAEEQAAIASAVLRAIAPYYAGFVEPSPAALMSPSPSLS